MPSRAIIDEFLAQDHLAFLGASREPRQFANTVYRQLRSGGRTLYPVHPEAAELGGDRCYRSLADVPDPVAGVVIMLPPDRVLGAVREAIARGVPRVWLHRGTGTGCATPEAVAACRDAGVAVVDGACPLMFAQPVSWFHKLHRVVSARRFAA